MARRRGWGNWSGGACLNSMRELVYSLWQTGHVGTWHDSEKADCSSICRWQATCMYRSRHAHTPCTSDEIGASCVQMKHSPHAASLSSPITWTAVPGMASLKNGSAARSTARSSAVPALPRETEVAQRVSPTRRLGRKKGEEGSQAKPSHRRMVNKRRILSNFQIQITVNSKTGRRGRGALWMPPDARMRPRARRHRHLPMG